MHAPFLLAMKILFIGDSHSVAPHAPFGATMNRLLRSIPNAQVITHARCGSTLEWWYTGQPTTCGAYNQDQAGKISSAVKESTPKIAPILQSFKPNVIVIEMGGNYLRFPNANEKLKADLVPFLLSVKKLKKENGTQCYWVGPPSRRDPILTSKMQPLIATLQKEVKNVCEFFDSSKVTQYPTEGGDGIHYSFAKGNSIGNQWAEKAFQIINH